MEEMPSLNLAVQRLKIAVRLLDLICPGPVTHSGEILITGKSHGKKQERFSLKCKKGKMLSVVKPRYLNEVLVAGCISNLHREYQRHIISVLS